MKLYVLQNNVKRERDQFKTAATSLDRNYATEMEGRITSSLSAAQAKLAAARTNEDSKAEVEALTAISQLGYEQGKLAEIKSQHAMEETAANERPTLQPHHNNKHLQEILKQKLGLKRMIGLVRIML